MPARSLLLGPRGRRLWTALLAQDESLELDTNPMREVALSACRTADRVDELERIARDVETIVDARGVPMVHPVQAEVRQQAASLARLLTALRLPDEVSGKRPQRRGMRGSQKPSQIGGRVSSLDAARVRADSA